MLKIWWMKKLLNGFDSDLVGIIEEFWGLLRDSEIENFPFFVGFDWIIAATKLILY